MSSKNKVDGKLKTKTRRALRVALSEDAEENILIWKNEIENALSGQKIHMSTFISKLLEYIDLQLHSNIKTKLQEYFFDPIIVFEKITAEVRRRRKTGEKISINEVINNLEKHAEIKRPLRTRKKNKVSDGYENIKKSISNS